ncbi:MAG: hypothetical protein JSR95_06970 [Proteobacteria bacterium]|nr:hypothetical protein [Pseudomonadota bacterium]
MKLSTILLAAVLGAAAMPGCAQHDSAADKGGEAVADAKHAAGSVASGARRSASDVKQTARKVASDVKQGREGSGFRREAGCKASGV